MLPAKRPQPPSQNLLDLSRMWNSLPYNKFISVHRHLIDITGNLKNAIYLSQFLYWQVRGTQVNKNGGYTIKSVKETEQETGLTLNDQRRCKEQLIAKNLISTETFSKTDEFGYKIFGKTLGVSVNIEELSYQLCRYFHIDVDQVGTITPDCWKTGNHPVLRRMLSHKIVYHRDLVDITGDIYSAVMMSIIVHSCLAHKKESSSFTAQQWSEVLRLGERRQVSSRKKLSHLNLITEKHLKHNSRRIFTIPNGKLLLLRLQQIINRQQQTIEKEISAVKHDYGKTQDSFCQYGKTQEQIRQNAGVQLANCRSTYGKTQNLYIQTTIQNTKQTTPHNTTHGKFSVSWVGGGFYSLSSLPLINQTDNRQAEKLSHQEVSGNLNTTSVENGDKTPNANNLSNAESEQKHLGNLKNRQAENIPAQSVQCDFSKLHLPYIFRKDNGKADAIADLSRIAQKFIPQSSTDEVQEILDEMTKSNVKNPFAYFAKLCQNKASGTFFAINAPDVKREREAYLARKQKETEQKSQHEQCQKKSIEESIAERLENIRQTLTKITDDTELKHKLITFYDTEAMMIGVFLNQITASPNLDEQTNQLTLRLQTLCEVLVHYSYRFNQDIGKEKLFMGKAPKDLRQWIIDVFGEERIAQNSDLTEIINMPEMQGNQYAWCDTTSEATQLNSKEIEKI